uniref:Membrane-bound metal-dependent hydrolase n=1 Tax=uncultured prokaryote TaxID=198431 RepID=A0A0H5PXP0_9ZZZZ|nr:hypothetical protein [uncultured prokaryote]
MTWKSHMAIAAAVCLPLNPHALPLALAGSTAPDWIEMIIRIATGKRIKHRGETHYLIIPIIIILIAILIDYKDFLFWFGVGYLTHWFADSVTITGVPVSPLSKNNVTLFGGRIRTGDPIEYILSFGLLFCVLFLLKPNLNFLESDRAFNPYLMDYSRLNEQKIIDNKEFLERRFKFF